MIIEGISFLAVFWAVVFFFLSLFFISLAIVLTASLVVFVYLAAQGVLELLTGKTGRGI